MQRASATSSLLVGTDAAHVGDEVLGAEIAGDDPWVIQEQSGIGHTERRLEPGEHAELGEPGRVERGRHGIEAGHGVDLGDDHACQLCHETATDIVGEPFGGQAR